MTFYILKNEASWKCKNSAPNRHFRFSLRLEHFFESTQFEGFNERLSGFLKHEEQIDYKVETDYADANESHLVLAMIIRHHRAEADDWVDHKHQTYLVEHF